MLALCLSVCMVAPAPEEYRPGVRIQDAKAFGLTAQEVNSRWQQARSHADTMRVLIWANNGPETSAQWEAECAWRARAWDLLDDVIMQQHFSAAKKLHSLTLLREMLGDKDYFAGKMPDPTPKYRK